MSKAVVQLGFDPSPFVSLRDRPRSVFVDPASGNVFVDEGAGESRVNGVVLFAAKEPRFAIRPDPAAGTPLLFINYRDMEIDVGDLSECLPAAEGWVRDANAFLAERKGSSSALPTASAAPSPAPRPLRPSRRDPLDADIEAEMQAALAGMDEKAVYGEPKERKPKGQPEDRKKKGRVVSLHADDVFLDVGGRSQGVAPLNQFPEGPPKIGDVFDVEIEGYDAANGLLLLTREGATRRVEDWSSVAEGMIVEARVTGTNKGGLQVDVNGLRGFIPISHIELFRVEDVTPYVNQRLRCTVTEVKPEERNLVLSRRALLDQEREQMRERTWNELAEGQVRKGVVRSVKDFGAFVDLGGVDGLLHIGDMSWSRVESAEKLVQVGQPIEVKILKLDQEKKKISLGLKQLGPSPWDNLYDRYSEGVVVTGKVTRLMDFGAFVELEPGVEGLVHISELAPQRVRNVKEIVQPGKEVQVKVLKMEPSQRRISLSIKATVAAPEPPPEPEEPEKKKKGPPPRKTPLKGGLGSR